MTAVEKGDGNARVAFLDDACGSDEELRRHVDLLLGAHAQPGSFLDKGAVANHTVDLPLTEKPGTILGPYKLLQQIGEGGMGVVFMAEQTEPLQRTVALKIIKPGMDTRQVIARFEAERQAVAMMDHPNIAKVLDAGTTDSCRPYFVMELVKGVPITKYCDEKHLPLRARLELFVQVCQAVQHAHQKGIIHRDIKPNNVLVAEYDNRAVPKVIDFGVAKATAQRLTERTMFTEFGQVLGTMEYMSPEQSKFNQLDIDTRSDIYSLGVLLYELLAGSTPFEGKRLKEAAFDEMLRIIREEEPQKPSTRLTTSDALPSIAANRGSEPLKLNRSVQGELDWIVMKALEKDRNRRYETASSFAADIERHLHDEPVEAGPPSAAYRFRKFARRNKTAFAAGVAAAAILLLGLIGLAASNVLITREKNQKELALGEKEAALQSAQANYAEARKHQALAKANEQVAKTQESLARRRFYAAQMNLAMVAWDEGEAARTLELLEGQRPLAGQEDLREFEWYYLWRLCHRGLKADLNDQRASFYGVAFLPDGKTLASADAAVIKMWDLATGREKATWKRSAWALRVSPDGKTLASWGFDDPLRLWNIAAGEERAVLQRTVSCSFSPDGSSVAFTRGLDVEFWDVAESQRRSILHLGQDGAHGHVMFLLSPDGKTAVARIDQNLERIYRWDGVKWQKGPEITGHGWGPSTAFSPDSKTFAIGGTSLKLYEADTGNQLRRLEGHRGDVLAVAFSPDGKSLASASHDRTMRVWDPATGLQRSIYPHPSPLYCVAYSPDGSALACGGPNGTLRVWEAAPSNEEPILRCPGGVTGVAFSPDGKTLAASGSKSVKLWNAITGRETGALPGRGDRGFAFSHDGAHIAVPHGDAIDLWSVSAQKRTTRLQNAGNVVSVAFSADNQTLACGTSEGAVTLWNLSEPQQPRLQLPEMKSYDGINYSITALAFSPEGHTLASGGGFEHVFLWDATTGRARMVVQGPEGALAPICHSVAFSADGNTLAVASQAGTVRLWELANPAAETTTATARTAARLQFSLSGHTSSVRCVAFSPDGQTLATASEDGTVRLWDPVTGQEKATLRARAGSVRSVAFSPDGNTLASANADGTVSLWRAAVDDPRATALRAEPDRNAAYQSHSQARGQNMLAMMLAKADDPTVRDATAAVELARGAVSLKPDSSNYYNTLGIVHYHAGQWNEAIAALEKSNELRNGRDIVNSANSFFLAMAHWQLGHKDQSRTWYTKAIEWMDQNKPDDPTLMRFRTEADQLLKVTDEKPTAKPSDELK